MLLTLHNQDKKTWASSVCFLLYRYGFGHVWQNQGVGNINQFLSIFKARLKDCYQQEWHFELQSRSRFSFYNTFKSTLSLTPYLVSAKCVSTRSALTRMRLGVSPLRPHRLRYTVNIPTINMNCPFCPDVRETEIHFLLICPKYQELRERYIPRKFWIRPSSFALAILLANENTTIVSNLSTFVYKAFQTRCV